MTTSWATSTADLRERPLDNRPVQEELRHGAVTLMLAAGVPDAVAIKMMGRRDTRILRRYQKVIDRLKREAVEKLDQLLGSSPN